MNKQELIEHIGNTLDKYLNNTTFVKPVLSITETANSDEVSLEFEIDKNCIMLDDVSYQFGYDKGKLDGEWVGLQLKDADKIRLELNKPVVPQFVADWYEENKDDFENALFRSIDLMPSTYEEGELSEFEEWLVDEHTKPFQILVNLHQFGYKVEKEKLYLVKFKGISEDSDCLNYDSIDDEWYLASDIDGCNVRTHHTRKELENAGFGWVFSCEGIEVDEVEE